MARLLKLWCEEEGANSIETIALAAVVLILLTAAFTYLSTDGRLVAIDAINGAIQAQIGDWRGGAY